MYFMTWSVRYRCRTSVHLCLRYLSVVSWFSQILQVLVGAFIWAESDHSWYIFFSLFSTYTLLPLPLLWSIATGTTTSVLDVVLDVFCHYGDLAIITKVGLYPPFFLPLSLILFVADSVDFTLPGFV